MITFEHPLALVLLVPVLGLSVLIWRNGYVNLSRWRARVALGVRLAILVALVFGLAGMDLTLPQSRQATIMLADLSASDAQARGAMQRFINQAAQERPSDGRLGIVTFGRHAQVEQPPSPLNVFDGFQTRVDPNYSNLSDGLSLGGAIMPNGYRRRLIVMSDGRQNVGDALATARLVHSLGVRVDVWPAPITVGPEVLVDSVTVPPALRASERFTVDIALHSTVDTRGTLSVYRDHALVISRTEAIRAGETRYTFAQEPLRPGFHTYQVQVAPARDTQPQNNIGSAFTLVAGPPKVLVISPSSREAANVLASLRTTGIQAVFQRPGDVVPTLSSLQRYEALVLVDTPADSLSPDLLNAIVPYVRDLGHGLVVIGGRESYGVGGYSQTGLEKALPVKMDVPKRKDLPSAAVVLIIENLESDAQVDVSREAGKGVIRLLTPQDQVAVDDAEGNGTFPVPMEHVTNKRAIDGAIDFMQPGDPETYASDLQAGAQVLRKTSARVKHIIILGDGDAEDPGYEQLAKQIRASGITISTIATNGLGLSDFQTMRDIAMWGGGRYYRADNPAAIPRIFVRETRTVVRSGLVEGKFYPEELSASPMLRDLRGVPDLTGYVATTPRPTGEEILASQKLDPVLAAWQFGVGRSVAWTSDAAGLWTRDWLQAPGANRFWANLVAWTLPPAQHGQLYISSTTEGGDGRLSIDTQPSLGANPSVTAHIVGPNLQATTIQLEPAAPGQFGGSFPASAPGTYFVTADARGVDHSAAGQIGLDVPYSAEYRATGTDMAFIRALASAGGGSVVTAPDNTWQDDLAAVYDLTSLQSWLWLLALLLLPIDIGVRRLVVSREDLAAIREALRSHGRQSILPATVTAPLHVVRQERARRRVASARPAPNRQPAPAASARISVPVSLESARDPAPRQTRVDAEEDDGSTSAQLLAAKRRRRS
jgi:uncharacterized membrane protein